VIEPKPNLMIDDLPFPFQSSTQLYPEWNLAAQPFVPQSVTHEVQDALVHFADYVRAYEIYNKCLQQGSSNATECEVQLIELSRCDVTKETAMIAKQASTQGEFSGWTTTLSYMELRNMQVSITRCRVCVALVSAQTTSLNVFYKNPVQESTGFIRFDREANTWRCIRSEEIYDAITCAAPNSYIKSRSDVQQGCAALGLQCKEGYQCLCAPCHQAFYCIDSVDVGGRCVSYQVLLSAILVPVAVIAVSICLAAFHQKSRQMVHQAERAARNERELNEFIAHEVRNPLSSAISACTFVNATIRSDETIQEMSTDEKRVLREDFQIIQNALHFINDLLRSMLDVHRASIGQMQLEKQPVEILKDIFEPVMSMIWCKDSLFEVKTECSDSLIIETDRLRLQQVVLNLAKNSAKFVEEGFIKLRATTDGDGNVNIIIEDSGPGIPEHKRSQLFNKFQKSLDLMAQGTGIGLCLCKSIVELMGGEIVLDAAFRSGYKNFPGTRLIIRLPQAPIVCKSSARAGSKDVQPIVPKDPLQLPMGNEGKEERSTHPATSGDLSIELPSDMSLLFVDDDRILRKQALRALSKHIPSWKVREAASGETAVQLAQETKFDIIFLDQYMTSVEQSLTGIETTRMLRRSGCQSIICGLSANELDGPFHLAGADAFALKPFPCSRPELIAMMQRLLAKCPCRDVQCLGSDREPTSSCSTSGGASEEDV